ncbi:MAG TPA: cyanophycin synthetase, partial [Candidatus Binatia bacterium]|nr:cyanophycin synthetase [Candidatus Binatia bacterium]
ALLIIDDYAHHPSEIKATLKTMRRSSCRRIVAVFQPHRFTRLQILMKPFSTAFRNADVLVIAKLYTANQKEIPGVSSRALADAVKGRGQANVYYLDTFAAITEFLRGQLQDGDGLVFLSAGNLTRLAHDFATEMEALKK